MTDRFNPLVSVIMPAYGAEAYIEEAIASVQAQTYENWELLVLEDCSPDRCAQIVEDLAREDSRIRLLRNEKNMGVARTRNRGLDLCRGDYVALLDSDDLWRPTKLEKETAKTYRFPTDYYHEDFALWLDMLRGGRKAVGQQEVLGDYRVHSGSRASNKAGSAKRRWKIYRSFMGMSFVSSSWYLMRYALAGAMGNFLNDVSFGNDDGFA